MSRDPNDTLAVIVGADSGALRLRAVKEAAVEVSAPVKVPGEWMGTRHALLALGLLTLLAVGVINVFEADYTGVGLLLLGAFGLVRLRSRLAALVVWITTALIGLAAVAGGDARGLLLVAVGAAGAVAAAWPDQLPVATAAPGSQVADALDDEPEEPAEPESVLQIRTIGRIALQGGGQDLTGSLVEHRVLAFIWLYLLTHRAAGSDGRVARGTLGQEVSPLLDAATQRQRLRGQIRDLQKLPAPLGELVQVEGELVGLDLADCHFDVDRLRGLVAELRTAPILSKRQQRRASELMSEIGSGLFLPGWEEIEHRATGGKGDAGQLVAAVRAQVSDLRADVALALGQFLLSAGQPANAIQFLEDALGGAPLREDVARLLVTACVRSGKTARAEQLEAEYELREKV